MKTSQLHRGRLIDHLQLVVKDLGASRRFYLAGFGVLGIPLGGEGEITSGRTSSSFRRATAPRRRATSPAACTSPSRQRVARSWTGSIRPRLAAGGRDNGAPGDRRYHPGYYACFVLDPDGNNVEAVFHGPARRSAGSVSITF